MIDNDSIKHVAVYLRLSRDEENQGIEKILGNHRRTLTELVMENNWSYEVFEEIASSRTIEHREKMVELLERIKQNEFDAIVVIDIDRLSRNEFDSSEIKRVLFTSGTSIVTPSKFYNLSKDEDNLLLGIQSLIAAQEYKQIIKRMQRGKRSASKLGHFVNGVPPLGYDKNPSTRKLEPNDKAHHIKYIFQSILDGKTISEVYKSMNQMGVKTKTGSKFAYNSILRIINNEAYKGTIISNRIIGKHGEVKRPEKEWIVAENAHKPIIDEESWEKANKIVNTYKFASPRAKNKIYPTTGLIYCGICGKVQGTQYHGHIDRYYLKMCRYCGNRTFSYEPVLKMIKEEVGKYRQNVLDSIVTVENVSSTDNIDYEIKQLETQLRKSRQALDNILILFEESEISLKEYRDRKAKRMEQIEKFEQELDELKQRTPEDKVADLSEVLSNVNYLLQKWEWLDGEGLTNEEVNRALHFIIERMEWTYPKGVDNPEMKIKYFN
jgi:site-specific DNA recombinase